MGCRNVSMFVAAVGILFPLSASAQVVDSGTCPPATAASDPSGQPPTGKIAVTVLSMDLNSDMEGDDDYVPFYDNRADVYGKVTINGTVHDLKEIEDDDDPEWHEDNRFVQTISEGMTTIDIQLKEEDSGITFDDDDVDASPGSDNVLHLTFEPCSLMIGGDYVGHSQGIIEVNTGSGSNAGKLRFRVEMDDGRAISPNDVSLVDFDLIQVIGGQTELVGAKNTVALVRVGSTANFSVNATLRVAVADQNGVILRDETIQISPPLKPYEIRKIYMFKDAPMQLPERTGPYTINAAALVTPQIASAVAQRPCYTINNTSGTRSWTVVRTRAPRLLWARVGTLMDFADYATTSELSTIRSLGSAFIDAVYPIALHVDTTSPIPLTTPVTGIAADWLLTVLGALGLKADCALPFLFTFELNAIPILTGHDRLMGVLKPNWFERFTCEGWHKTTGVSLVEAAPHAVIFEARSNSGGDGGPSNPALALPGHELGHTYGLSTDPELKNHWACDLGSSLSPAFDAAAKLMCGAYGGFDEYKHPRYSFDAGGPGGVPAWGYWVSSPGGVPAEMQPLVNQEQCDSVCIMGGSPPNAHLDWASKRRWIDHGDYARMLDKLKSPSVGGVYTDKIAHAVDRATGMTTMISNPAKYVYLSGAINGDHQFAPGPWYVMAGLKPDANNLDAPYRARFRDSSGGVIYEYGIPLSWNNHDTEVELPVTFFGVIAPFPSRTAKIEIYKRENNGAAGPVIFAKTPSAHVPTVAIVSTSLDSNRNLTVDWSASDVDGDALKHTLMISPDNGVTWWPAVHDVSGSHYTVPLAGVGPGTYLARVLSSDGLWLGFAQTTFVLPMVANAPVTFPTRTL